MPPRSPHPRRLTAALCAATVVGALVAAASVADTSGWFDVAAWIPRVGAMVASWCALVLLTRRCGGQPLVVGGFAAVVLVLVGVFPEPWALAGAAVAAATTFGVLAVALTRPAIGVRVFVELVVSAGIGVVGAFVVAGYSVELRPYRFRVLVLALVLPAALALAWRLGRGMRGLGRRGAVVIGVAVVVFVGAIAYTQAIRAWGSPDLLRNLSDGRDAIVDVFVAAPRPVEALVGFPAIVWGVAMRVRRQQGWWVCAFGALGAGSVVSSLVDVEVGVGEAMLSTGYDVVVGGLVGALILLLDRLLVHGGGRRADSTADLDPRRPEPPRFEPLL